MTLSSRVPPICTEAWGLPGTVPLDVLVLRPRRVAAAQLESKRVAERLVQDGLNVVRDVRTAYVELVVAQERFRLAEEGSQLRDEIARIAEARLKAGAVAELDVSTMRLESLFGKEEVSRDAAEVDLARQRLCFLLGVQWDDVEVETTELAEGPAVALDVDALVTESVRSRPDLRAIGLALRAACEKARLARHDYFNLWGVLPDINGKGEKGFEAGPGLRLTVLIFHQNQGAVARADAEVERLQRQYATLRGRVALEVRQAHTRLVQARQSLRIWREEVGPQAEEAVIIAREALKEDGVSLLLVLETTRQLLESRRRELQAAADVHLAVAELERSVGRRVADEAAIREGGPAPLPLQLNAHVERDSR